MSGAWWRWSQISLEARSDTRAFASLLRVLFILSAFHHHSLEAAVEMVKVARFRDSTLTRVRKWASVRALAPLRPRWCSCARTWRHWRAPSARRRSNQRCELLHSNSALKRCTAAHLYAVTSLMARTVLYAYYCCIIAKFSAVKKQNKLKAGKKVAPTFRGDQGRKQCSKCRSCVSKESRRCLQSNGTKEVWCMEHLGENHEKK